MAEAREPKDAAPTGLTSEERARREGGASRAPGGEWGKNSETLTPVEKHLAEILATIQPLAPTELSLSDAHGLVLAEDVTAASALPSFDNSGMDGYAVRVEDVAGATAEHPVVLPVVAEIAAGDTGAYALPEQTAIRIMTGAMLPHGTEAVVPVELTDGGPARVAIRRGRVRRLGAPSRRGRQGRRGAGQRGHQAPPHAHRGHRGGRPGAVLVRPRPRVVVLSTGSELAEPGTPIIPGRIWDSNSFMIAAAVREAGALAYRQAIVPDHPEQVLPAIEDQLVRADLVITTGGVSMGGEHDVVKAALAQLGTISFRKVAMQPGMPQGFGTIAAAPSAAPEGKTRRGIISRVADRGEVAETPVEPGAAAAGCRSSRCPATRSAPTFRSRSSSGPRWARCRPTAAWAWRRSRPR